jgi:hypothetical protein
LIDEIFKLLLRILSGLSFVLYTVFQFFNLKLQLGNLVS